MLRFATIVSMAGVVAVGTWASAADDEKKIPAPADIDLETSYGLQMQATYYGQQRRQGRRADHHAARLEGEPCRLCGARRCSMQAKGCAVIVPDLRGHGKSTQIKRNGDLITIDQATSAEGDIEAMVTEDLEAVKTFLVLIATMPASSTSRNYASSAMKWGPRWRSIGQFTIGIGGSCRTSSKGKM